MNNETPTYIKSLVTPTTKQAQGRKVWSIDLQQVWLPFFTATNTMGDTAIPSDAIGCPLRLGYDKAGQVRFSQSGRHVVRVVKEIADNVRMVRDNFTANLLNYAGQVAKDNPEGYKAQITQAVKAGEVIATHDKAQLSHALQLRAEAEAEAQAEAVAKEEQAVAKAKGKRELVHA
ncbi:MAG: hypothetical protein Q7K33_01850 [Candidatus Berkelbacteria bacterium]|nr:hypothetical protein [Candidatus Berkelbacteria bacterium]